MISITLAVIGGFMLGSAFGIWLTCYAVDKKLSPHIDEIEKILNRATK